MLKLLNSSIVEDYNGSHNKNRKYSCIHLVHNYMRLNVLHRMVQITITYIDSLYILINFTCDQHHMKPCETMNFI